MTFPLRAARGGFGRGEDRRDDIDKSQAESYEGYSNNAAAFARMVDPGGRGRHYGENDFSRMNEEST